MGRWEKIGRKRMSSKGRGDRQSVRGEVRRRRERGKRAERKERDHAWNSGHMLTCCVHIIFSTLILLISHSQFGCIYRMTLTPPTGPRRTTQYTHTAH